MDDEKSASNIVFVSNRGDACSIASPTASKHIVVLCPFDEVADCVEDLCQGSGVFSIMAVDCSLRLRLIAGSCDTVAVFVVDGAEEAVAIAEDLVRDPHTAIKKALNSEAVSSRYAEGSPS